MRNETRRGGGGSRKRECEVMNGKERHISRGRGRKGKRKEAEEVCCSSPSFRRAVCSTEAFGPR